MLLKGAAILMTMTVLVAGANRYPRLFMWGTATATGLGLLGMALNVACLTLLG